jgi:hypothetical protein
MPLFHREQVQQRGVQVSSGRHFDAKGFAWSVWVRTCEGKKTGAAASARKGLQPGGLAPGCRFSFGTRGLKNGQNGMSRYPLACFSWPCRPTRRHEEPRRRAASIEWADRTRLPLGRAGALAAESGRCLRVPGRASRIAGMQTSDGGRRRLSPS